MKHKEIDEEFDIHFWVKGDEDGKTATVSIGKRAICIDYPLNEALDVLKCELGS